jgi:hypothetical protein
MTLYEALYNLHFCRTQDKELSLHLAALDMLIMDKSQSCLLS